MDRKDKAEPAGNCAKNTDNASTTGDYFSINRTGNLFPHQGLLSSPTSATSYSSTSTIFNLPKYGGNRHASNLNLLLSPIATSPASTNVEPSTTETAEAGFSPLSSSNANSILKDFLQPSVLHELEQKASFFSKHATSTYLTSILPHDYLNMSLDLEEPKPQKSPRSKKDMSQVLSSYTLISKIHDDKHSDPINHYLGEHKTTKQKFVIRFIRQLTVGTVCRLVNSYHATYSPDSTKPSDGYPSFKDILKERSEHRACPPDLPGIYPCTKLELLEDEKGIVAFYPIADNVVPLSKMEFDSPVEITTIILLLVNILKVIKNIHKHGIVNNTLLPSDIFVDSSTYDVFIMGFDFSFSTDIDFQEVPYRSANKSHSLNYIPFTAPENFQNLVPVDFRADIYGAGAIIYFILSKRVFKQNNLFILVAAIITLNSTPLHIIDSSIPIEFSKIISQMINKDPKLRYSSVDHIIHDLVKLYRNKTQKDIPHNPVPTSQSRIPILIPTELVGRDEIIKSLLTALSSKCVKTFTLTGETGIGKSSVLESLRIPAMTKKMFFTTWKCQDLTYVTSKFQTFDLILSQLLRDILSMDKLDIAFWRDILSVEIKSDLSLLFDTVPEMRILLGPRYTHMRQHKMNKNVYQKELGHQYILKKLFELFSRHAGWVLVIEDIGNLAEAEATILQGLWSHLKNDFRDGELNFTLLTSYTVRGEQTSDEEDNIPSFLRSNVMIEIPRLTYENVERYLSLSLQLYDSQFLWKDVQSKQNSYYFELSNNARINQDRRQMAELLHKYSHGNPLIINRIIIQIHFAQLRSKTPLKPSEAFKSIFTIIKEKCPSGDVFFDSNLHTKDVPNDRTVEILKYAACICVGNLFDMYDLSIVTGFDVSTLYKVLSTGIITQTLKSCSIVSKLPVDRLDDPDFPLSKLSPGEKRKLLKYTKFKFFHETIQHHLIRSLKDANELEEFHRNCGLRLFENLEAKYGSLKLSSADCFSIAYHFINSWKVARPEEYSIYTNILITAGWYAYSSYEHVSALRHFQIAKELTTDPQILKGLEWVEIHIYALKGKHEKSIDLIEKALQKYQENFEDVAQFLIAKMQSLRSLNKWEEAFEVCLNTLKALEFPLDLSSLSEKEIEDYTNFVLRPKLPASPSEIRELKNLPLLKNRRVTLVQMVLMDINQFSVYLNKPYLFPFANLMNVILLMENGKSVYSSFSLIILGSLDAIVDAKGLNRAHEYCKLAFSIVSSDSLESNELFIISFKWYCCLVGSLIEPIDKISQSFDLSIMNSKAQMVETTFSKGTVVKFKFQLWLTQGLTAKNIQERMEIIRDFYRPDKDPRGLYDKIYNLVIDLLSVLAGSLSYDKYVEGWLSLGLNLKCVHMGLTYNVSRCFSCYILRKYEVGADIAVEELVGNWSEELASIEMAWARYFFVLLIYKDKMRRADINDPHSEDISEKIANLLKNTQAFFKELSARNPSVFTCMFLTIDALIKVMDEDTFSQIDILAAFEIALESSVEYHHYLLEAIVAEECARWLTTVSKTNSMTTKYLKIAYNAYKTWGLTLKVEQIEQELISDIDLNLDLSPSPLVRSQRRNSKFYFQNDFIPFQHDSENSSADVSGSYKLPSEKQQDKSVSLSSYSLNNFKAKSDDGMDDGASCASSRVSVGIPISAAPMGVSDTLISECGVSESNEQDCTDKEIDLNNIEEESWDNDAVMGLSTKIALSDNFEEIIKMLLLFSIHLVNADYGCFILNSDDGTPCLTAMCLKNDEVRFFTQEILSLKGDVLPVILVEECMKENMSIWRDSDKFYFDTTYKNRDPYFESNICKNVICVPVKSGDSTVVGALYLENQRESTFVASKKIDLLEYLCLQGYISMSKMKLVEKLELAKKAAEEATADRTNFLANMSHEIRTPFNSLMSCAIFLLDTKLTKSQRMYVETIRNSAMVTLSIIDGILSFSKIEHGSLLLTFEPFNLTKCIEDAVQLVAEQAALKKLELVFIDDNYPVTTVYGDETRIVQVIINLLGNSSKFTNKGYIFVHSSVKEVAKDRYEFTLTVKDSGIGIPEGSKARLFKMFNQLDGSSKRVYGGSGLGLAISKKLAEYMGGDVDYESKEGEGTSFCFTITSKAEKHNVKKVEGIKEDDLVAILDPRELSSLSLKKCIERRGFETKNVIIFDKLDDEARAKCRKAKFIFIYMEVMKGKPELKRLREEFPKSVLIYEVPFGVKIPAFIEENDSPGDSAAKLIDFVLLTPFKREKLDEILQNEKQVLEAPNGKKPETAKDIKLGKRCPLTILVAEDNMINTKMVRLQLKRLGYDSDHAKDGVEAVEKNDQRFAEVGTAYDLILMDLQMPRKDGYEAAEEIKLKFGDRTRIVALSANVYSEEKARCLRIGMSGFLSKPLLPDALAQQLEEAYFQKKT
ncbi:hypothetical protein PMKS-003009 [Pichia membranifaciens]|uniref:histidine kinase n=1 Tax=Pichia membranifaciens TaxID=4926 RepID=A0A1Q2YIY0_9ASCO|nr:hypothetical protein PMKS-003009 [Pichia membranifaciens]